MRKRSRVRRRPPARRKSPPRPTRPSLAWGEVSVDYPLGDNDLRETDRVIEDVMGKHPESSGMGPLSVLRTGAGGARRDLQFEVPSRQVADQKVRAVLQLGIRGLHARVHALGPPNARGSRPLIRKTRGRWPAGAARIEEFFEEEVYPGSVGGILLDI